MTAGPRLLQTGGMAAKDLWSTDPRDALRVGPDFDLASFDRNGQPGWDGDKDDGQAYLPERGEEMSELQERLFAEGREVTFVGKIEAYESTRIGDYDYQLPRVAADVVYLWPEVREVEVVRPYPYYDPFWGPRWGRWGWW